MNMEMVITIIACAAAIASAIGILFANRICRREMSREGLQILCSLVFCWVGTWQITSIFGLESIGGTLIRPYRAIGFTLLAMALLLWYLSRYIK